MNQFIKKDKSEPSVGYDISGGVPAAVVGIRLQNVEGALCACVIRLRVYYHQNDETLSRNSLICMRKAKLPIALT